MHAGSKDLCVTTNQASISDRCKRAAAAVLFILDKQQDVSKTALQPKHSMFSTATKPASSFDVCRAAHDSQHAGHLSEVLLSSSHSWKCVREHQLDTPARAPVQC